MTATFVHGKGAYFNLDSGGSPTDVSSYIKKVDSKLAADLADVTCLGATAKSFIKGLEDATYTIEGYWDATMDGILYAARTTAASFQFGPAGSTGGYVKYSGECYVKDYSLSAGVDGMVSFSAEIQVTGAVTRGTF